MSILVVALAVLCFAAIGHCDIVTHNFKRTNGTGLCLMTTQDYVQSVFQCVNQCLWNTICHGFMYRNEECILYRSVLGQTNQFHHGILFLRISPVYNIKKKERRDDTQIGDNHHQAKSRDAIIENGGGKSANSGSNDCGVGYLYDHIRKKCIQLIKSETKKPQEPWVRKTPKYVSSKGCKIGYGFSVATKSCRNLKECRNFTSEFVKYKKMVLWGHNARIFHRQSPDACVNKCLNARAYLCKSVNHDFRSLTCYPKKYSWYEAPSTATRRGLLYHFYERQCGW